MLEVEVLSKNPLSSDFLYIFAQTEQAVMKEVGGSVKSVVTRLGVETEEEVSTQIWKKLYFLQMITYRAPDESCKSLHATCNDSLNC